MDDDRCAVDGCERLIFARGLCEKHYEYLRRHGTVNNSLVRRMCPSCFKWFIPARFDQIYDTEACRAAWFRKRKADPSLPAHPDTTPHMLRYTGDEQPRIKVIPFTRSQVVAKCHRRCAICHRLVDLSLPEGTDDSAIFIWAVPPSRCGVASLANRILAHQKCAHQN